MARFSDTYSHHSSASSQVNKMNNTLSRFGDSKMGQLLETRLSNQALARNRFHSPGYNLTSSASVTDDPDPESPPPEVDPSRGWNIFAPVNEGDDDDDIDGTRGRKVLPPMDDGGDSGDESDPTRGKRSLSLVDGDGNDTNSGEDIDQTRGGRS